MINVDDLLKPIADGKPCGEDFTYHPSLQNLETIARGKSKTQFDPPDAPEWKEPDWQEVQNAAIDVLGQSKHLTAGVILTVSLLKIGGLEGFRDGLAVVHGLTEKYWGDVYPKLNPEDKNDPTERLNILSQLSSPRQPYQFIVHLEGVVLCSSQLSRITLQQVLAAKQKGDKTMAAQIQGTFRDAGPDTARATFALVNEAIGHVKGLESFLDSTLGAGKGVNFESLNKLLAEMKRAVEPYAPSGAPAGDASSASGASAEGGGPSVAKGGPGLSGTIQTRADAIKALELICDYYRDNEPSSPVPLILQRAQRLVDKDFMTIVTDLTPDAVKQLQVITGTKAKE